MAAQARDETDDRTTITEALMLGRGNLIAGLAGLNDELERTSRLLKKSEPPPAHAPAEDLEEELV